MTDERSCPATVPTCALGHIAPVPQVPALVVVPEGQRKVPVGAAGKDEARVIIAALDGPQGDPRCDEAVGVKGRHAQVAVPVGFTKAWLLEEHTVLQGSGAAGQGEGGSGLHHRVTQAASCSVSRGVDLHWCDQAAVGGDSMAWASVVWLHSCRCAGACASSIRMLWQAWQLAFAPGQGERCMHSSMASCMAVSWALSLAAWCSPGTA